MIDAYTHLDMSAAHPIDDLAQRMKSAKVGRALIVETWSGDNRGCLQELMTQPADAFRIALCFRPEKAQSGEELLTPGAVQALRVRTADLHRLGPIAGDLQSTKKWLLPHAESGIAALTDELLQLTRAYPELPIYLPHMGWPRHDQLDDDDWVDSIRPLGSLSNLVVGVSAIAHFSRDSFPHEDVADFASHLFETFGADKLVAGSDYPLCEKDQYSQYMELASSWIGGGELAGRYFESSLFDEAPQGWKG